MLRAGESGGNVLRSWMALGDKLKTRESLEGLLKAKRAWRAC